MDSESNPEVKYTEPVTHKKNRSSKKKEKPIVLFSSNSQGARIRNALSGSEYDDRVGSPGEKKYWKVAAKDIERWQRTLDGDTRMVTSGYDTCFYFFDCPEQYERLRKFKLDDEVKASWYKRNNLQMMTQTEGDEPNE